MHCLCVSVCFFFLFFFFNSGPICCLLWRGVLCSQLYLIVLQPERERERERAELNLERERMRQFLVLAVMEPGDLQPLTVYNEHAPCAHGHRNPQQSFGVSKEVMRRGQETQVVMLGGTLGFSHHAVVPPHFAGSSSVASLPCGHTTEGWRNGEKIKRKARMGGWRDGGSNSSRFGMDGGRVPIILRLPWEYILTKWSLVCSFTFSQCDYRIVSDLYKTLQCNFALWRPRVAMGDNMRDEHPATGCLSETEPPMYVIPRLFFSFCWYQKLLN